MKIIATDCLVLGAGLAGSAYALRAARAGLRVELLSLGEPLQANSDWAQGGIIYDTDPDPAKLTQDILSASDGTANLSAIEQLVRDGPGAVKELLLEELKVGFDRDDAGVRVAKSWNRLAPVQVIAERGAFLDGDPTAVSAQPRAELAVDDGLRDRFESRLCRGHRSRGAGGRVAAPALCYCLPAAVT